MDEISMLSALRPAPPDDADAIRRRARARLDAALRGAHPRVARPPAAPQRRRRTILIATGAVAAATAAVAAPAVLPGGGPGSAVTSAWAVTHRPDGTIKVTIRELHNPAGLRRALRAAGVPARVEFPRHEPIPLDSPILPQGCHSPHMSDTANAKLQGKIMPPPTPVPGSVHTHTQITWINGKKVKVTVLSAQSAGGALILIRPSAIPHGIGLFIQAWAPRSGTALSFGVDLVRTSQQCTGP